MKQDWQRVNTARAEQPLPHDSWRCYLCACLYLSTINNSLKIKKPTEINSKLSSSDSRSDPCFPSLRTTAVVSICAVMCQLCTHEPLQMETHSHPLLPSALLTWQHSLVASMATPPSPLSITSSCLFPSQHLKSTHVGAGQPTYRNEEEPLTPATVACTQQRREGKIVNRS